MRCPVKIGIAEDHLILRQGLIALLGEFPDLEVLIDASNGKELLQQLNLKKTDVILLDIEMPVMDGRETLEKLQILFPEIKVIIMSNYFHEEYIQEFMKKGASAFLEKNCSIEQLTEAIKKVVETGFYFDNHITNVIIEQNIKNAHTQNDINSIEFTKQELKILKLVCQKLSNAEIAETLSISIRTVEGHRYNISKKTNTNNTILLIDFATKYNLNK